MDFAVIDVETTGHVRGFPTEVWQVGLVHVRDGQVDVSQGLNTLVRVDAERPFNKHAPGRHAVLRETLAQAPRVDEVTAQVMELCRGRTLVAHNIGTERKALNTWAPLHPWGEWVDTLKLYRRHYPGLESYTLDSLVQCFGLADSVTELTPGLEAHDAYYDAVACAVLLSFLLRQIGGMQ